MNSLNTLNLNSTTLVLSSNSRHYEIDASTILSTANHFKNMTDLNHENIRFQTLFQQFSLDIGRFDVKVRNIYSIRLFAHSFFFVLASLGLVLIDTNSLDSIISNIFNVLKYIEIFIPEESSDYIRYLFNICLLILYISLSFFLIYLTLKYKRQLCVSLSETYIFVIVSRIFIPIFTSYVSYFFTFSLYRLIFRDNAAEHSILFVISLILLIGQISFIFISCSAYNATPVIRKHDSSQTWYSHSFFDWLFLIMIIILIFLQTFLNFLSKDVSSIIFAIVDISISVGFCVYVIHRLPFIYPKTNVTFLCTFLTSPFCSICPILSNYAPSSLPYYLICVLLLFVATFFIGRFIINRRMIATLSRFDSFAQQTGSGLIGSFKQPNSNSNFQSMTIKDERDLSLLTRVGFLFNVPEINNASFVHYGLEVTTKADFILSAVQVMLAIQSDSIVLTNLYQASLTIGKGPFNLTTFLALFNLMRQEMLTQLNKPLIEAITFAKRANHYLELTISNFWGDVIKQRTDSLFHLLPRITEETEKAELLFLRLVRNYPLSPVVYREIVVFYYKIVGDHHKALHFQGMIDKAKSYQYNRPTYNQQNNLALYSSFSSSSSRSTSSEIDYLGFETSDMDELHEKLESYILAQDSIMAIPLPPLFWMYAIMIVLIIIVIVLPAVILTISLKNVRNFQSAFTPIETIGDLDLIVARIPQLIRRRNLLEIDHVISPQPEEAGPPVFIHTEFVSKESIDQSLSRYRQRLLEKKSELLDLCVPGATITQKCSERVHRLKVDDTETLASVFDLLSTFETGFNTILSDENFNWTTAATSSAVLSILSNFDELYSSLNSIITTLTDEINDFHRLTTILLILIWIVPFVIMIPLAIGTCVSFKKEVTFTLKLFFQIPKNEILNLKSAFKKKKHDKKKINCSPSTEYCPNSANILLPASPMQSNENVANDQNAPDEVVALDRVEDLADSLATVPKQIRGLTGTFMFHVFVLILFTCLFVTIGIIVFNQSNTELINMSNAYASSINVFSSTCASYVWTQELFSEFPLLFNRSELKKKSYSYVTVFISKFNNLLYGNSSLSSNFIHKPVLILGDDIVDMYMKSQIREFDPNEILYDPLYGIIHNVYITMSCESQMRLFTLNSQWLLDENSQVTLNFNDTFVYHYEHILFSHLSSYLSGAVNLFSQKANSLNDTKIDELIMIFVVVFLVDALFYLTFIIKSFKNLIRNLKTPRFLLLLVPPEALLKTQSIVKWMSGMLDSSKQKRSTDIKKTMKKDVNDDFITQFSSCGVFLASNDLKVKRVNETFCKLFQKDENEIIGLNFITFLRNNLIDKDKNLFTWLNSEIHKMLEGTSDNYKCHFDGTILSKDSKMLYVTVLVEGIQDYENDTIDATTPANSFSVVIIDKTVQKQVENYIDLEKEKIKSIYDHVFFEHIQKALTNSESNALFEVKESTIMFSSIDNWDLLMNKSSGSSMQIMSFLNKLFAAYDGEIKNFPALTKLKTIGNTYIICGGLFEEESFNSARVVVDYALKILAIGRKMNERNESGKMAFDLTIGINTGGPIACGVLGRVRPTLHLMGEAVKIADMMNSNGLPGFIQISESTYDNIKYSDYNIKERAEMQINDSDKITTYLVSDLPFKTPPHSLSTNRKKDDDNEGMNFFIENKTDDEQVKPPE